MTGTVQTDLDVVAVGESMVLLSPPAGSRLVDATTLEVHAAGAEANVAVHLARFGCRSAWVGKLGADPLGQRVVSTLRDLCVDVSAVEFDELMPTGVYFKDFNGSETEVHYYRSGSAATTLSASAVEPVLRRARVLHMSGITAALSPHCHSLVEALLLRARSYGVTASFDVNYRPSLWDVERAGPSLTRLARLADIVFVGRDEAERVWGVSTSTELRRLLSTVPTIVLKDGGVGATVVGPEHTTFVPAPRVTVVEPVGAGDAFAAGYLWGLLDGQPEDVRLRRGHLAASAAMRSVSDHAPMPPKEWFVSLSQLRSSDWAALDLSKSAPVPGPAGNHSCRSAARSWW